MRPAPVAHPRLLVEARGDFALEAKVTANWDESDPGAGWKACGLVIWKDGLNHVHLNKYAHRSNLRGDLRLVARVGGAEECAGRGQLEGETYVLRLERTGERFAALCSTDGVDWLTCGRVMLPVKDPLWAGVWAGDGMVVHFDYARLLGRG